MLNGVNGKADMIELIKTKFFYTCDQYDEHSITD